MIVLKNCGIKITYTSNLMDVNATVRIYLKGELLKCHPIPKDEAFDQIQGYINQGWTQGA